MFFLDLPSLFLCVPGLSLAFARVFLDSPEGKQANPGPGQILHVFLLKNLSALIKRNLHPGR